MSRSTSPRSGSTTVEGALDVVFSLQKVQAEMLRFKRGILMLAAFVFMFTLVLAANLFSDVVLDAFDPRLRQQR